jgi:AcrR family transcriptional regulator
MKNEMGIRDRKRLETRARLEDAAVFLVLQDGLERTTVDAISEKADVSPRTFFNYFESKDSAILGVQHVEISDELVAEQVACQGGQEPVEAIVRLLFRVMGAPLSSRSTIHEDRIEVLRRHPEILGGQLVKLNERAGRLTEAVKTLLSRYPRLSGDDPQESAYAEVMLAMCSGAVRAALREWAASNNTSDVEDVQQRATSLVKDLVGKLK